MSPGRHPTARPATGLFFCRCGPNLGAVIQLGALAEERWDGVAVYTHDFLCAEEGQAFLVDRVRADGLERVVLAACSPREHQATFERALTRAGLAPHMLQRVNLREQGEWRGGLPEAATNAARALIQAALARAAWHRPLEERSVEASPDVLVVGGGAAGLSAALTLAQRGRRVLLVERAPVLGGLAYALDRVFPDGACASCFLGSAIDDVLHHQRIEVRTLAELVELRGRHGRFQARVRQRPRFVDPDRCVGAGCCEAACPVEVAAPEGGPARRKAVALPSGGGLPYVAVLDPELCLRARGEECRACADACQGGAIRLDDTPREIDFECGAVVVATGLSPGRVEETPGVISAWQLERMLHPGGPTGGVVRGPDGRTPRAVLLALAEGAEEADGDLGRRVLLELAGQLKALHPQLHLTLAGGCERAAGAAGPARALARAGVKFAAGALPAAGVAAGQDGLWARLAWEDRPRRADLVVVWAPVRPAEGAVDLARALQLPLDGRGFLAEGASPFRPTGTRVPGIQVAGGAAGPRDIRAAIRDGVAAAGLVLSTLVPGQPIELSPLAAEVDETRCSGCGICRTACPSGAIVAGADGASRVESAHCAGCGTCAAACPSGAIGAPHFTTQQLEAELSGLLSPSGNTIEEPSR